jgi:nitrate reductase gamma subunit
VGVALDDSARIFGKPGLLALAVAGAVLLAAGLAGWLSAAWGYGLFAAAAILLGAGSMLFAIFAFSAAGDTGALQRGFATLFAAGAVAYVLALFALAGHYVYETLQGRMEWHWVLFGPMALAALVILDVGLYRKLYRINLPTWQRYRQYIKREDADPAAMRRTLVDDVIVHRSLYQVSKLRWLRHTLIFWGFMGMFAAELIAVFLREGFPAFGWRDVWREPGHPVRLAFDFVFDFTGLMVLAGCVLALVWRAMVNATPERKYADTPTTLFLLFVVASGFVLEGLRIAPTLGDPAHGASFVGVAFAWPVAWLGLTEMGLYKPLWVTHVIGACVFIAYVPLKRLIHTCATPIGRLMNSQKGLLAAKKRGVIGAMLLGKRPMVTGMNETSPKR